MFLVLAGAYRGNDISRIGPASFCTQPGKDEVPKSEPLQRDDEEIPESHVQKPATCFNVKRSGSKIHSGYCCFTTMIQLDHFLLPPYLLAKASLMDTLDL